MRTFVAVPIPPETLRVVEDVQNRLRSHGADVRWPVVSSLHLTLKFIGELNPEILPELAKALRAAVTTAGRFCLSLRGIEGFPDLRNPRVLWCGIQGETDKLASLQQKTETACCELGFPPEHRPFQPHLTLGRVAGKRNLRPLLEYIKIIDDFESTFTVDRLNIYRSVLGPQGAVYTVLERIDLTGD